MEKIKLIMMVILVCLSIGCTNYQTVDSAQVGKVLGKDGLRPGLLEMGNHNIGWEPKIDNKLITLDIGVDTFVEKMEIPLADKQVLKFDVKVKARVKSDDETRESVFSMIPNNGNHISLKQVYNREVKDIVRNVSRGVLSPRNLEEVQTDYSDITRELDKLLADEFKKTSMDMLKATIGKIEYPASYTKKVEEEKAEELNLSINKKKEEAKRELINQQLLTVQKEKRLRTEQAEVLRLENLKTAAGLNPLLIEYQKIQLEAKRLEVDLVMAQNIKDGKGANVIYYPIGKKPDYIDYSMGNQKMNKGKKK